MNNTFSDHLPMSDDEHRQQMPPLPPVGEVGPQVCATMQLYLGVLHELTTDQEEIVLEHVRNCVDCAAVQRLMQHTTRVVGGLPDSMPSARVNEAVKVAIATRSGRQSREGDASAPAFTGEFVMMEPQKGLRLRKGGKIVDTLTGRGRLRGSPRIDHTIPVPTGGDVVRGMQGRQGRQGRGARWWWATTAVALAAVLVLAVMTTWHFTSAPQSFTLPATLSWNGYVIYHSETKIDTHGVRYRVDTYYDPGNGRMHVETSLPGNMDVVAVGDGKSMLGMDMMHHVAQWNANGWSSDESMFNLTGIRNDLKTSRAAFIDKDMFRGQAVYRIRCSNGLVLLLNMRYEPVNVLRGAVGPGTGEPIYDTLVLMPLALVSSEMWDARVPSGFRMGVLPQKP